MLCFVFLKYQKNLFKKISQANMANMIKKSGITVVDTNKKIEYV